MDRVLEAHGGRERLQAVERLMIAYRVSGSVETTLSYWFDRRGNMRKQTDNAMGEWIIIHEKGGGWEQDDNGQVRRLELIERGGGESDEAPLLLPYALGNKAHRLLEEPLAGVLRLSLAVGELLRLSLDPDTGRVASSKRGKGKNRETWGYQDYREVDGLPFPWEVTLKSAQGAMTFHLVTLAVNPAWGQTFFSKPPERNRARLTVQAVSKDDPQFSEHVSIPCQFDGSRAVITVKLNDDPAPRRFLLDTGSNRTILAPRVAQSLRLQGVAMGEAEGFGNRGPQSSLVALTSIKLEGMEITGLLTGVFQLPGGLDGILGYDVFRLAPFEIDFDASTVRWYPKGYTPSPNMIALEAPTPWRIPLLQVTLPAGLDEEKPFVAGFQWDTGNSGSWLLTRRWVKAHGWKERGTGMIGGVAGAERSGTVTLPWIRIAGVEIPNVQAQVFEELREYDGNVGMAFFRQYFRRFVLDYEARRAYLLPR